MKRIRGVICHRPHCGASVWVRPDEMGHTDVVCFAGHLLAYRWTNARTGEQETRELPDQSQAMVRTEHWVADTLGLAWLQKILTLDEGAYGAYADTVSAETPEV